MDISFKDEGDPIICRVMEFNKPHKNSDYKKSNPMRYEEGNVYAVWFKGPDGQPCTQYVIERRGRTQVYRNMDLLLRDSPSGSITPRTDREIRQLGTVAVIAGVLILGIIFMP